MKSKFRIVISLLFILVSVTLVGCGLSSVFSFCQEKGFCWPKNLAAIVPSVLVNLTNQDRADNLVPELVVNPLLVKAAQLKADDMAKNNYFAHQTLDGKNFIYFLNEVGYNYKFAGENLAFNFTESEDVAQAWMNSPTHRANLLQKNYTEIGIASATGTFNGREGIFVAQYFGTPVK